MKPKSSRLLLASLVVAVALGAVGAGSASASPVWKFNGTELSGKETVVGAATSSKMTLLGITVECQHFLYNAKIFNKSGKGEGEVTELPLYECSSNAASCPLEKEVEAKNLPWPGKLTTIGEKEYLLIGEAKGKEVDVNVTFGGSSCAVAGVHAVKGTVGGVINNSSQTATFDAETIKNTGTGLKVGSSTVEWEGVFTMEAFESHRLSAIEA
ncbi:MAG TPA: hypothetical protein VNV42_01650 [Solirubrobacteraceae bacterium]|nr:hypothetical protein [Solirubrobacteraceae bacterium]